MPLPKRIWLFAVIVLSMAGCSGQHRPDVSAPSMARRLDDVGTEMVRVRSALDRARRYLLSARNHNGHWERQILIQSGSAPDVTPDRWGECTSLATYALLESGSSETELQSAVDWLLAGHFQSVRAIAYCSQIAGFLAKDRRDQVVLRDVRMLLSSLIQPAPNIVNRPSWWPNGTGFYPSACTVRPRRPDRGASEAAISAMAILKREGGEVPALYWQIVRLAWLKSQRRTGGWSWADGLPESVDMTAAGLAVCRECDAALASEDSHAYQDLVQEAERRAERWLNSKPTLPMGQEDNYTLYCLARARLPTSSKNLATEWPGLAATKLIHSQSADGSWNGPQGRVMETSYALLLLNLANPPSP